MREQKGGRYIYTACIKSRMHQSRFAGCWLRLWREVSPRSIYGLTFAKLDTPFFHLKFCIYISISLKFYRTTFDKSLLRSQDLTHPKLFDKLSSLELPRSFFYVANIRTLNRTIRKFECGILYNGSRTPCIRTEREEKKDQDRMLRVPRCGKKRKNRTATL